MENKLRYFINTGDEISRERRLGTSLRRAAGTPTYISTGIWLFSTHVKQSKKENDVGNNLTELVCIGNHPQRSHFYIDNCCSNKQRRLGGILRR